VRRIRLPTVGTCGGCTSFAANIFTLLSCAGSGCQQLAPAVVAPVLLPIFLNSCRAPDPVANSWHLRWLHQFRVEGSFESSSCLFMKSFNDVLCKCAHASVLCVHELMSVSCLLSIVACFCFRSVCACVCVCVCVCVCWPLCMHSSCQLRFWCDALRLLCFSSACLFRGS
jgi:hypothetical protein